MDLDAEARVWTLLGLLWQDWRWRDPNESRAGVTAVEHALQCAAAAERHAPGDDELVAVALLHDAGRVLSPARHGEVMAEVLADRVRPDLALALRHHGVFQHAALHGGGTGFERESWYPVARLLAAFDGAAFRVAGVTPPVEHFLPRVVAVVAGRPAPTPCNPR